MAPSFCPALTILLDFPLSSANSLHSPTTPTLLINIPPHTILPSQLWSSSFPPSLLPQPIHSLCHSLFLHPHQLSSPPQPAFQQSHHQVMCTPVSCLSSTILLLSTVFIPAIFLTQLFSQTCSLCYCLFLSSRVSKP